MGTSLAARGLISRDWNHAKGSCSPWSRLNAKAAIQMNLQMSSCGSACWTLSPSSLQHPHYTGVPCCPLMPAQVPHPPKGLVVCRSPCVKLRGWLIAFNPDCGGRALDFFEAKGTSPVTQLAWALFSRVQARTPLPCVLPLTSAAVQSCSHHSTFLRRQMFFISLLGWKDFCPAGGSDFPSLHSLYPLQVHRDTAWCQHPIWAESS